jgi:hypothetical protein
MDQPIEGAGTGRDTASIFKHMEIETARDLA